MTAEALETEDPEELTVEIATEGGEWPSGFEARLTEAANAAYVDFMAESGATPTPALLSVLLTDDETVRLLNRDYRDKDKPTNVLSFPDGDSAGPGAPVFLGDIAMAWETVAREAEEQEKTLSDHFTHLVVHGMLHLMGMDHEDDREAEVMEARETAILERLGVPDPYKDEVD